MRLEGGDIGEGGVADTGIGMAVIQGLAHVRAAAAHQLEPGPGHPPQFIAAREPGLHGGRSPDGIVEAQQVIHAARLPAGHAMSSFCLLTR